MASSYVEVKEAEHDTNVLSFGLEALDENGIAIGSQLESDLPKDHTYTKGPDIQDDDLGSDDNLDLMIDSDQKPTRGRARAARATTKKSNVKTVKGKKASPAKKSAPVKKVTQRQAAAARAAMKKDEEFPTEQQNGKLIAALQDAAEVAEAVQELEKTSDQPAKNKRKGNRRKVEEKENVADKEASDEGVADLEDEVSDNRKSGRKRKMKEEEDAEEKEDAVDDDDAEDDTAEEVEAKKGSKKPSKAKSPQSPKKKKVTEKEHVAAKPRNVSSGSKGDVPKGWVRKVVERKSGKTAGQVDIYIYSPEGMKFRSKPDVAAYLARTKSPLKLDDFNFSRHTPNETPFKTGKSSATKEKPISSRLVEKNVVEKKKHVAPPASARRGGQKLVVKLQFSATTKSTKSSKKVQNKRITKKSGKAGRKK